jgi:hypothetical protein
VADEHKDHEQRSLESAYPYAMTVPCFYTHHAKALKQPVPQPVASAGNSEDAQEDRRREAIMNRVY